MRYNLNIESKLILEPISIFMYFKMEYLWIWGREVERREVNIGEMMGLCFHFASLFSQEFLIRDFDCKSPCD